MLVDLNIEKEMVAFAYTMKYLRNKKCIVLSCKIKAQGEFSHVLSFLSPALPRDEIINSNHPRGAQTGFHPFFYPKASALGG